MLLQQFDRVGFRALTFAKYAKTPDALIAATVMRASAETLITNGKWERLIGEGVSLISRDSFQKGQGKEGKTAKE